TATHDPAPSPMADATLAPPPLRRLREWPAIARPPGLPLPRPLASTDSEPPRFDWAGETARAVGVLYHRWMQFIAADGVDRWTAARATALQPQLQAALRGMGVPATRREAAATRVAQALANTLADARGRW